MAEFFQTYALWIIWIVFGLFSIGFFIMAPCHAIFLLPFIGIPLFWLLPLGYTLPINLAIWVASPFLFRAIRRAMKKPASDGFQSLVGTQAKAVVSRSETDRSPRYMVRVRGELWTVYSEEALKDNEQVNIVGTRGIGLVVVPAKKDSDSSGDGDSGIRESGIKDSERNCH